MSGNTTPILWYENEEGEKWFPPADFFGEGMPEGFRYQHFRNPLEVHDSIATEAGVILRGCQTYNGPLALALAAPSLLQQWRAVLRYGSVGPVMALDRAILFAACSCERCMNAMCHRVGLNDGYRQGSAAWHQANTSCEWCEPTR